MALDLATGSRSSCSKVLPSHHSDCSLRGCRWCFPNHMLCSHHWWFLATSCVAMFFSHHFLSPFRELLWLPGCGWSVAAPQLRTCPWNSLAPSACARAFGTLSMKASNVMCLCSLEHFLVIFKHASNHVEPSVLPAWEVPSQEIVGRPNAKIASKRTQRAREQPSYTCTCTSRPPRMLGFVHMQLGSPFSGPFWS